MDKNLGLSADQLRSIPLLKGFDDAQIEAFTKLAAKVEAKAGAVLFEAGEPAVNFYVLVAGEVTLHQDDEETHRLHPPSVIGELGAVTGLSRNSRAVLGEGAEVWRFPADKVKAFFEAQSDIGLQFQANLLDVAADKINRDQTRLQDMRTNLIRTQRSMKKMRDFLLESQDTVVSRPLHEILDGLIRQNRRVNYRVSPPEMIPATCKLGAQEVGVLQISRTHLSLSKGLTANEGDRISGVLSLSGPEIPVSGRIIRIHDDGRVDAELDLLIDEYVAILEGYLTRIQLLDFLV